MARDTEVVGVLAVQILSVAVGSESCFAWLVSLAVWSASPLQCAYIRMCYSQPGSNEDKVHVHVFCQVP